MSHRWLAVLIVIVGLGTLALFVMAKGRRREMRARREQTRAVRRFGRRKGEPRPWSARRRQRLAASE